MGNLKLFFSLFLNQLSSDTECCSAKPGLGITLLWIEFVGNAVFSSVKYDKYPQW